MNLVEILFLAVAVAVDAFSVALCIGTAKQKNLWKTALVVASFFGIFQFIMPIIGGGIGVTSSKIIGNFGNFVAALLLSIVAIKMIVDACKKSTQNTCLFNFKSLLILAFITSIDSMLVGASITINKLSFTEILLVSATAMGIITAILSFIGVFLGCYSQQILGKKAEIFGGIVLILISLKFLFNL